MKVTQIEGVNATDLIDQIALKVANILNNQTENKQEVKDELMTRKETAKFLKVSLTTLYHWDKKGVLVAVRVGGKVMYNKADLVKTLVSQNQDLK